MVSFRDQAEEFLRLYAHIPQWKQGCADIRTCIEVYTDCHVDNGGMFTDADLETVLERMLVDIGVLMKKETNEVKKELMKTLGIVEKFPFYFITVNYPPDFKEYCYMNEFVETIRNFKWIHDVEHVHEFYGKSNNHPHTHLLIRTKEKMKPSEVKKLLYKAKGIAKKIPVNELNYSAEPVTYENRKKYINGHKTASKLEQCSQDEIWRNEHGLNT